MFDLTEHSARLKNINVRSEIHGDEMVPACDLKLEIKIANDFLSEFHPTLKNAIYRAPDANDSQTDLLKDEPGYMPSLRFQHLGALKWQQDYSGYDLTIHYGISGRDDIHLIGCDVNKIVFDCQEGGSVVCNMRIQSTPDAPAIGRLCTMIQQDVTISLTPPK
jgi:hypothetical protein